MGRGKGKLKLELIGDKKSRESTFKRRKENLVKKTKELSQLCGVDVCMIVYSPDHRAPVTVCGDIGGMVDLYRAKSGTKCVKTVGVSDVLNKEQPPETDVDEKAMIKNTAQLDESEKPAGEIMEEEDYSSLFFDYGNYELYDSEDQLGQINSSTAPLMADENVNCSSDQLMSCAMEFNVEEFGDEYWAAGFMSQLCTPPPQPVMLW